MSHKQILTNLLKNGIVKVRFRKVDGSIRDMICTQKPEYFSTISYSRERLVETDLVTVWDVEKDSWRSFNVNSVLEYSIPTE